LLRQPNQWPVITPPRSSTSAAAPLADFLRRTCRTRFSALPVEDIVRELLLAHARPGLHKVYDLHAYEKEKADAFKLWHANLRNILEVKSPGVFWRAVSEGSEDGKLPGISPKPKSPSPSSFLHSSPFTALRSLLGNRRQKKAPTDRTRGDSSKPRLERMVVAVE
jgi:hypothetical protein